MIFLCLGADVSLRGSILFRGFTIRLCGVGQVLLVLSNTVLLLVSYNRCDRIVGSTSCRCGCRTTGRCFMGKRCTHSMSLLKSLIAVLGKAFHKRRYLCVLTVNRCYSNGCSITRSCFGGCCRSCPGNVCIRRTHCCTKYSLCRDIPSIHLSRDGTSTTVERFRSFLSCCPCAGLGSHTRRVVFTLRSGVIRGRCGTTGLCCSLNSCKKGYTCNNDGCRTYVIATHGTLLSFPCTDPRHQRSFSVVVLHTGYRLTRRDIRSGHVSHCHSTVSRCCNFVGRCPRSGCQGRTRHLFTRTRGCIGGGSWVRRMGSVGGCKLWGSWYTRWRDSS